MTRTRSRIAALVCAGLLAPIALSSTTAGAVDQDLVVSATSGAPGTTVAASSATCPASDGFDTFTYFQVRFISGTGSDAVLAGASTGDTTASFIVPDWIDPDQPAVIEASCVTVTFPDFDGPATQTIEPYDPVAFDVVPGPGAPTQSRTFSRTSLQAGQAFAVAGEGCDLPGEVYGGADLAAGADLSGRTLTDFVASGGAPLEGTSFDAQVDLNEDGYGFGWSSSNGGLPHIEDLDEPHTDIPAGTYTAIPYCGSYDEATDTESYLMLEPQLIEVTGDAPFASMAWSIEDGTNHGTLAGQECTSGDVTGSVEGVDLVAESAEFDEVRVNDADPLGSPFGRAAEGPDSTAGTDRVGHNEYVNFTALPAADGSWAIEEDGEFQVGILIGQATCGDPLADGFFYDLRLGGIEVPETTTTTVPTTAPPTTAAPANAVSGTPDYAG